jgi:O-antigen/teichoic acid export membrane protein
VQDFVHAGFLLTAWLAIGVAVVVPLLLVPVFGERFAPAVPLLTLFAALALAKGAETTLCRVLYSVGRQAAYVRNLGLGTILIIALNILLIPRFGLRAAAAVLSTTSVALACVYTLRSYVRPQRLAGAALRTGAALALVAAANALAQWQGLGAAPRALIATLLFPLAAFASGLVPSTRRGSLFGHTHGDPA